MATKGHVDLNTLLETDWLAANTDDTTPIFSIAEEYNFYDVNTERCISMHRGGSSRRKKDVTFSTISINFPVAVEVYSRTSEAHMNNMSTEVQRIIDSYRKGVAVGTLQYSEINITNIIPASYDKVGIWREVIELEMKVFMKDV